MAAGSHSVCTAAGAGDDVSVVVKRGRSAIGTTLSGIPTGTVLGYFPLNIGKLKVELR